MNDNDTANFKIRLDDESPDVILREEFKKQRIDKLSQRITVVAVLLPCLIGIVLLVAYLDIKKRVATNIHAGTTVVTNLSKDIESQLSSISLRHQEFEKNITHSLSTLEKSIASINSQANKIEKSMAAIRSSKSDKKELESALIQIDQKLLPIQTTIDSLTTEFQNLGGYVQKEISDINDALSTHAGKVKKVGVELSALKTNSVDKNRLARTLKSESERYLKMIRKLEQEITSLKFKIKSIESASSSLSPEPDSTSEPGADKAGTRIIEQTLE